MENIYFKVKNILTEGTNKRVIFNIFYPFYRIYNPIVGYLRILNPLSNPQRITNSLQQNFFFFAVKHINSSLKLSKLPYHLLFVWLRHRKAPPHIIKFSKLMP